MVQALIQRYREVTTEWIAIDLDTMGRLGGVFSGRGMHMKSGEERRYPARLDLANTFQQETSETVGRSLKEGVRMREKLPQEFR